MEYDVIVIGGGPAGVKCATTLAKGGKKVALIEKEAVGGTCLNRGCIPSKTYLHLVELLDGFKKAKRHGIEVGEVNVMWEAAKKRKDMNVKVLGMALAKSLECSGVEVVQGMGILKSANEVQVGDQVLKADKIVLAIGSRPIFPGVMAKGEHVVSSTEVLDFEQVPESMCIIGGGVTGVEMASIFSALGTKVSLIELQDQLLPFLDKDIGEQLAKSLKKKGCDIYLGHEVLSASDKDGGAEVTFKGPEGEQTLQVSKTLVVIGRMTSYDLEKLAALGIDNDGRRVVVNDNYQTSLDNIYMVGDSAFRHLTAYGGEAEAEFVAGHILGHAEEMALMNNLSTVFSHPEVGHIGKTEKELEGAGVHYDVHRSDYAANAKAVILGEREGFVKILSEKGSGRVLGCSIIGTHAADLIHQAIIPVAQNMTVKAWLKYAWSHPVLSEVFKSALEGECEGA